MKIVKFNQHDDREAFLNMRRGTIGGSNAKDNLPLSRGKDRRPAGFWKLLAEKLFVEPDGENPLDRGLRVEANGVEYVVNTFNLDPDPMCGMWVSDEDKDLHVTPDGAEKSERPTWAIENKSLNSENHMQAMVKDIEAQGSDTYNPFESLQVSSKIDFRFQVKSLFSINKDLRTVYFNLHDDRATREELVNYTIVIDRDCIPEEELEEHKQMLLNSIHEARNTIRMILKHLGNE